MPLEEKEKIVTLARAGTRIARSRKHHTNHYATAVRCYPQKFKYLLHEPLVKKLCIALKYTYNKLTPFVANQVCS